MNLQIITCSTVNRKEIEEISVLKSQYGFIESNTHSLCEADQFKFWRPVGLYDDKLLVGFAMYGMCEDHIVWLDRFMIASPFQGQGYGTKFLNLILQRIIKEYSCEKIYLSYLPSNSQAAAFYSSKGFKLTGEKDSNGEIIMCLNV